VFTRIKRIIRVSPAGPLAERVYRRWFPGRAPSRRSSKEQNETYDRETVEVMRRVIGADETGLDVGAHTGSVLSAIVQAAPRGLHHAFEPIPRLARDLQARFPEVRVHEAAAGDRPGRAPFVYVENDPAYSGLRPRLYDRPDPILTRITVDVVRIDDVVPPGLRVAFIKLDIEGGEFHALRGAAATIRRGRPVIVFEAGRRSTGQYGVGPDDLFDLLTDDLGCRVSTMRRWLDGHPPFERDGWRRTWERGREFYFIADPDPRHV
jgi:FkbM family methyltransferase